MAVVVGAFNTQYDADAALNDLKASGFSEAHLAVVSHLEAVEAPPDHEQRGNDAVDAAAIGGIVAAVVGGALLGPLGAVIGGAAVGGGFAALLMSRGVAEQEARDYEEQLHQGRVVITVEVGEDRTRIQAAEAVLARHGAWRVGLQES